MGSFYGSYTVAHHMQYGDKYGIHHVKFPVPVLLARNGQEGIKGYVALIKLLLSLNVISSRTLNGD